MQPGPADVYRCRRDLRIRIDYHDSNPVRHKIRLCAASMAAVLLVQQILCLHYLKAGLLDLTLDELSGLFDKSRGAELMK